MVGPIRKGDHTRSAVSLLQIGELTLAFLPGEVPGELVIGLPKGIKATPERWADETPSAHTPPDQITTPGYVKRLLPGTWTWAVGLGNDELGYILPLSDYRVLCVADKLGGAGACARLHQAGLIDFPDAVSGARCKELADDPSALAALPEGAARDAVVGSCRYGQAMGRPLGHYEETNSAGWDVAADMMAAVAHAHRQERRDAGERAIRRLPPPLSAAAALEQRVDGAMLECRACRNPRPQASVPALRHRGISSSCRLCGDRPGLEARGLEVVEDRVHAPGHVGRQRVVVLLDQPAHRERAEPDGLHVEGPDGALEMLAEVDEFGDHGVGRQGAQVGRRAPRRPGRPCRGGWA